MTQAVDLFKKLQCDVCAEYISDIKASDKIELAKSILASMDLSPYPLEQLNDMAEYIYGEKKNFADHCEARLFFVQ